MFNNIFSRRFIFCINNSFHSFQWKSVKLSFIEDMNLTPYCWRVSYKRHALLTLCEYPVFTAGFDGVHVAHLFIFCDVLYCAFVFCLSSSCVLCAHCCQCLLIVYSWLPPRFSLPIIYYSLWFYPNGDRTHDLPQHIRGEHANHFTTIAVSWNWKFTFGFLLRLFSYCEPLSFFKNM